MNFNLNKLENVTGCIPLHQLSEDILKLSLYGTNINSCPSVSQQPYTAAKTSKNQ
jgi:hypothetical protein